MRITRFLAIPLIAGMLGAASPAAAQVSGGVTLKLGPSISVSAYSAERWGEWRANYRHWSPVTLYYYDGHYYRRSMKGARTVVVYKRGNDYFLPPQESAWVGMDKRYNYKRRPLDEDYVRVRPPQ